MSDDFDDLDALAGEYVLGTLDVVERVAFAARLDEDPDARSAVAAWERRLASLAAAGDEVAPSAATWTRIAASLRAVAGEAVDAAKSAAWTQNGPQRAMIASRNRWRAAAAASTMLAVVALALAVAGSHLDVGRHPILVAAVNRGGDKPALMIRVDLVTRRVTVRPVATTTPSGHSLELWAVNAPAAPRSLGLVGTTPADLTMPAGAGADTTFAVSVEPEGGSKTGKPTGPVVYAGQLVED